MSSYKYQDRFGTSCFYPVSILYCIITCLKIFEKLQRIDCYFCHAALMNMETS